MSSVLSLYVEATLINSTGVVSIHVHFIVLLNELCHLLATEVLERSKESLHISKIWIAHDEMDVRTLVVDRLETIASYYGLATATYFAWL